MSRLFDKKIRLVLARPVAGEFFKTQPNAIEITAMRIQFSITRTLGKEPNTCTITVSNLAEITRQELEKRPLIMRLFAGYDDNVPLLFSGDVSHAISRKKGDDWETEITIGDGLRAFTLGRIAKSYRAGSDPRTMLTDLAGSMGLSFPTSIDDAGNLFEKLTSGVTLDGLSHKQMSDVLSRANLSWSVQSGRLQVLSKKGTNTITAVVVDGTSVKGSPELVFPTDNKSPPILKIITALDERPVPGSLVSLSLKKRSGRYKCVKVTHDGDSHGDKWDTTMEMVASGL